MLRDQRDATRVIRDAERVLARSLPAAVRDAKVDGAELEAAADNLAGALARFARAYNAGRLYFPAGRGDLDVLAEIVMGVAAEFAS